MDLVNKLWNFCHTLRHEGVDYGDYIEELTYLLFLKLADERNVEIPVGCSWNELTQKSEGDLLLKYNAILRELSNQSGILRDIFSEPIAKIHSSSSLRKLLNLIDEVNWTAYDQDVLGATFEGLLEKAANESKKGAGQYFTPRALIQSIVRVMKPDPFESENFRISDIACGTAGFLTESYEWWKHQHFSTSVTKAQQIKLTTKTYYGQELVIKPRRLALMNLYLHGLEPNITLGDTIYELFPRENVVCSCILTNPPFGTKGANQIPDRNFVVKTSNKQLNFIQHAYEILEHQGRAAIVLPDNVLFDETASELWQVLMEKCNLHTILKLPIGTFSPYAQGVKAVVVFFQKGIPTKDIWIFDGRSNIPGITKKGRPLTLDHFKDFETFYGSDPNGKSMRTETDRAKQFSIEQIKKLNYKLDVTWINDSVSRVEESENSINDIANDAISDLEAMIEEFNDIVRLMGQNG